MLRAERRMIPAGRRCTVLIEVLDPREPMTAQHPSRAGRTISGAAAAACAVLLVCATVRGQTPAMGDLSGYPRIDHSEVLSKLARATPQAPADFSSMNLSNLDLAGVDFKHANLSAAVLNGANLSGANLSGCNLTVSFAE